MSPGQDVSSKKWLIHIHKVLDALILDETFENFIHFEEQDLMK